MSHQCPLNRDDNDTNMFVERSVLWTKARDEAFLTMDKCFLASCYCCSFHNKLKTKYQEGKENRRVDTLVNLLLTMEQDFFIDRQRKLSQLVTDNVKGGFGPAQMGQGYFKIMTLRCVLCAKLKKSSKTSHLELACMNTIVCTFLVCSK